MRLKQIEITGFRGFATKQAFDLSASAIVVVGSNGLGKTSLLDAIHWGMTGRLSRISGGDEKLVSMYSDTGHARVVLTISNNVEEILITRVFDGNSQSVMARINNKEYKGTSAQARILELLWPESISAQDGNESLSSTLARSVYLQQDRVRDFLENATDQERFNVISELVGAGRLTEIQQQLESESRSWSLATTKLSNELSPIQDRVEELKAQLEKLSQSASAAPGLKESQWIRWWNSCKEFGIKIENIPTPASSGAASSLDKAIRETRALHDSNQRRRSLIESTLETVKRPPPKSDFALAELQTQAAATSQAACVAKSALKAGQERAAEFRKQQVAAHEQKEQQKALAQLAIQLLDDRCPVCQQSYDIKQTRARLKEIIDSSGSVVSKSEIVEDIEQLAFKEKEAVENEIKAKDRLSFATELQKQLDVWKRFCRDRLSELGIHEKENLDLHLESLLQACDLQEKLLKNHMAEGETLSLNVASELASTRIKSIQSELEHAQSILTEKRTALLKRNRTSEKAKFLIEQVRGARSKVAIDRLTEIEPLLQRVLARIDPHPTFRIVKFATDIIRGKGRLDTELHDLTQGLSCKAPEAILSSSQLNALAVSTFLSFNLAFPNLPLDAAILDDPIQSLDEINLLGLVDLLRRIKGKRQILVTTHDEKIGRLLARKLRPADSHQFTSVIEFRSWNRNGPEVRQYPVEADVAPLRLAKAS